MYYSIYKELKIYILKNHVGCDEWKKNSLVDSLLIFYNVIAITSKDNKIQVENKLFNFMYIKIKPRDEEWLD